MNLQPLPATDDVILKWLLRVARRADALTARSAQTRREQRHTWLRAEYEVFEELERASPALLREPERGFAPRYDAAANVSAA